MNTYFVEDKLEAAKAAAKEEIETKTGSLQLNPLKLILLPIQQILGLVCKTIYIARSFLLWDDHSVYAFVITNACLAAGVGMLFIPWNWLLHWTLHIIVWTFLGPWMKLIDIFIVRKLEAGGNNFMKSLEHGMEQCSNMLRLRKYKIMVHKEDDLKLCVKRYMFGKFIAKPNPKTTISLTSLSQNLAVHPDG
jgi:hypothetical protein